MASKKNWKLSGRTPNDRLIESCGSGTLEGVAQAVANGANIHARTLGYTPIMIAAKRGSFQIVQYLLSKGADPNDVHVPDEYTTLMRVCDSENLDESELFACLNLLLESGADPLAVDRSGSTALLWAIRSQKDFLTWRLLNSGCPLNAPDASGWTPVFTAVNIESLKMTQSLVDRGAKLNLVDHFGRSLQDIAAMTGNKDLQNIVATNKPPEYPTGLNPPVKNPSHFQGRQFRKYLEDAPKKDDSLYGFHDEAMRFIADGDLKNFEQLMKLKNLQLGQLLTWDEADWSAAGVKISYYKKKIKYLVLKYHEQPWDEDAVPRPPAEAEDPFQVIQWLAYWLHVTHINSTASLVLLRDSEETYSKETLAELGALISTLDLISQQIGHLRRSVALLESDPGSIVPDFIPPKAADEKKRPYFPPAITLLLCSLLFGFTVKYFV